LKMKYFYRFLFILIPIFMIGCPLVSKYPLGESRNAPMDKRYIGKWVLPKSTDNDEATLWILPFNENEYLIEGISDGEVERYRAYLTVIDNVHILNYQTITERENKIVHIPEREYLFIKISLSDNNVLTLWGIENKGFKEDHTKEELFQYVQKNIGNDNVYDKVAELKRDVQN